MCVRGKKKPHSECVCGMLVVASSSAGDEEKCQIIADGR